MRDPVADRHEIHASWQLDARIVALAARQHGVVGRVQLVAMGAGKGAIEHRVRRRLLHRVYPQTYAVGSPMLGREARWMAAVLAGWPGAVLSHWSAANLWGIREGGGPRSHVTVPRKRRNAPTIEFHFGLLPNDEVTEHDGIPVTTPTRTVLDLAPHMRTSSLTRVLEQIERLRLGTGPSIPQLLERYPRRAGTPKLRELAAEPLAMTRSELEARFVSLTRKWVCPGRR